MCDDDAEDQGSEEAMLRALERKQQSLEAYHRRLEAEARAQEARAMENSMPGALILGGIWLAGTLWKYRRRR